MPKGGLRPGAGRPKSVAKMEGQLSRIKTEMQAGFYASAKELAEAMPELVKLAIAHAKAGDKNLLRFLIDQFHKIVGALPLDEQDGYAIYKAKLLAVIEQSGQQPADMAASSTGDPGGPEPVSEPNPHS